MWLSHSYAHREKAVHGCCCPRHPCCANPTTLYLAFATQSSLLPQHTTRARTMWPLALSSLLLSTLSQSCTPPFCVPHLMSTTTVHAPTPHTPNTTTTHATHTSACPTRAHTPQKGSARVLLPPSSLLSYPHSPTFFFLLSTYTHTSNTTTTHTTHTPHPVSHVHTLRAPRFCPCHRAKLHTPHVITPLVVFLLSTHHSTHHGATDTPNISVLQSTPLSCLCLCVRAVYLCVHVCPCVCVVCVRE